MAASRRRSREAKRKRGDHDPSPRLLKSLPLPNPLPLVVTTVRFDPSLRWPIKLRNTRLLHAVLTDLTGQHRSMPRWSLEPGPDDTWRVVWADLEAGEELAATRRTCRIAGQSVEAIFGKALGVRAPAVLPERGARRVRVRTLSPVMIRSRQSDGTVVVRRSLGPHLVSSLAQTVAPRLGLGVLEEDLLIEVIEEDTGVRRVRQGGKYGGSWSGVEGELALRCNAPAHSLLSVAVAIGLGGRTAFGLGRIRIGRE